MDKIFACIICFILLCGCEKKSEAPKTPEAAMPETSKNEDSRKKQPYDKLVFKKMVKIGNRSLEIKATMPSDWMDPGTYRNLTVSAVEKELFELNKFTGTGITGAVGDEVIHDFVRLKYGDKIAAIIEMRPGRKYLWVAEWDSPDPDHQIFVNLQGDSFGRAKFSENLNEVKDYDGDGLVDLLKWGKVGGQTASEYHPSLVYRQIDGDKDPLKFEVDVELSKRLSGEKGLEWHGPKFLPTHKPKSK